MRRGKPHGHAPFFAALLAAILILAPGTGPRAASYELVTGNDYPPFTDKALPEGGLATEIVTTVFREMGHDVTVAFRPWKRGFTDTLSTLYLGTFPYGNNPKRAEQFHYSQPLYSFGQYFFALTGSEARFERDEDLQGLRVCLPLGFNPVRLGPLEEKGIIKMVRPPDLEGCFRMLARGRADLVRVNDRAGWALAEQLFPGEEKVKMLPKPVRETVEHFIVSRSYPGGEAIVAAFDATLARLREEGVIDAIVTRHTD